MYLYDKEGKRYLTYAGIAVNNVETEICVSQAISDQAQRLIHTFNYPYTVPRPCY